MSNKYSKYPNQTNASSQAGPLEKGSDGIVIYSGTNEKDSFTVLGSRDTLPLVIIAEVTTKKYQREPQTYFNLLIRRFLVFSKLKQKRISIRYIAMNCVINRMKKFKVWRYITTDDNIKTIKSTFFNYFFND